MSKIWFTSDWHFCHDKDFLWFPRGFDSIEMNNLAILSNHNLLVSNEDDVYVLGDLMLNDNEKGLELIKSMKGKLHIILGNHDTESRIELYKKLPNIIEVTYATILKYNKSHFYLSHYPTICSNYDDNKPWHKNLINLYGHTHQKTNFFNDNPYMYHVGVDSHNCYPVLIDDIIEEIRNKKCELNNESMKGE